MTRRRMKRPTATSTIESRNGIRQPQAMNCASVVSVCTTREDDGREQQAGGDAHLRPARRRSPRLPFGACSTAISTAPPHSPPTPMPCAKRSSDEQDRRGDADRRVGRQAADQERRDAP